MSRYAIWIIFCVGFFVALLACRQEQPPPAFGFVEANNSYQQYFGDPPEVREGKAYARVAFLPLKEDTNRVSPVPIYLFKESDQLTSILNRLASGELLLPIDSLLFNPFSSRINLAVNSRHDGTVTLLLELPDDSSIDLEIFLPAIIETAVQFSDIERVIVLVDNEPVAGMPDGGYRSNPQRVSDVAPPDLIMISGTWDEGEKDPEEIMVSFDRPVTINTFQLTHADGKRVDGEYFSSVFQMAIVVHPENPSQFRDGMELTLAWDVIDAKGRVGTGNRSLPLQKFEHKVKLKSFQNSH